jgi:hemoglobin
MMKHFQLRLDPEHFERRLALFAETARDLFPPDSAAIVIEKSHRIAQSLQQITASIQDISREL